MKCFLLLFLVASAWGQTSYVAPTRVLSEKGYQLGMSGDYFSTSKNVDTNGKSSSLKSGESFNRLQGEVSGYYGLTDQFQIGLGARFRENRSTYQTSPGVTTNASRQGIQSTFLSLMYGFKPVDKLQYTLEGAYRYTPYTNETASASNKNELVLGDDGNEYSAGLGVTYNSSSNNFFTARSGYRRPGKDLSGEVYWQLEGAVAWRQVALVAGVDGVSTLKKDAYTSDPQNKPLVNTHTTALYNSINREWITPYAGVNFALGKEWRLDLRGSQVVSGRSTDLGTAFSIQIVKRMDRPKGFREIDKKFKSYDLEAYISKVSPKKGYVVLDKGLSSDFRKGLKVDIFQSDYMGGNSLVATGAVIKVTSDTSVVKILEHYNLKSEIKEGLVARAALK